MSNQSDEFKIAAVIGATVGGVIGIFATLAVVLVTVLNGTNEQVYEVSKQFLAACVGA